MTRKATAALLTSTHHEDDWMESSSLIKAVDHISGAKKVENPFKYYHQDSPEPEVEPSDESSEDEEDENAPPQNFTGGKWKPQSFAEWTNDHESMDSPSPSYTKGKWIPGTKIRMQLEYNQEKISEEVAVNREVFWCSICARNLSNRSVYEQHLKSKLHKNRFTTRNELEEAAETLPTSSNELSKHVKERMDNLQKLHSLQTIEEKKQFLLPLKYKK